MLHLVLMHPFTDFCAEIQTDVKDNCRIPAVLLPTRQGLALQMLIAYTF